MSEQQVRELYRQGENKTVAFILSLLKELDTLKNQTKPAPPGPETPSGMQPVYTKPSRKGNKKRPGRKKGHPGSRRKKPIRVDTIKEHTLCACPECNQSLPKAFSTRTRYTEEIIPTPPEVTEHVIYRYWCSNCKKVVEPIVTDALPKSMIGLRTLIFSCWLHFAQGITLEKILQILNQTFQMKVTKGGLIQAWHKIADILTLVYDDIGNQAKQSAVLYIDETGWRVSGITHWLWCFTNHCLVYFVIDRSRGSPVIKNVLGSFFQGIVISDFFSAYNCIEAMAKQKCFSHIFTDLAKTDVRTKSDEWKRFRKNVKRFLKDAIKLHKHIKELDKDELTRKKQQLYQRLTDIYSQPYNDREAKRLAKRFEKHKDEILTFLDHPEIAHDNNHAERQIRPAVIARKNSYCNRSDKGAKTQAIFMTIFRTLYLRNQEPVESILSIMEQHLKQKAIQDWQALCITNS